MADDGAQTWEAKDTLTDAEFARTAENGAFLGLGRWELRRGKLHRMRPKHHPHSRAMMRLARLLEDGVVAGGLGLEVSPDVSVAFGGGFTPVPDIVVCEGAYAVFSPARRCAL
jgi:Uma2 family endonuclease